VHFFFTPLWREFHERGLAMRIAKGLYASQVRERRPQGGFDLLGLVRQARQRTRFEAMFGQRMDLIALVTERIRQIGFDIPDAAIREAMAEV
jgi:hypothetical protein